MDANDLRRIVVLIPAYKPVERLVALSRSLVRE